ncbi:MAG: hypothetical protein AAGD11_06500 [Planctomycetota bacterium]
MLKRFAVYFLVLTLVCGPMRPAAAVDLVWDDEGGSADKTWSNLGNWSPDNLPDSTDDLYIGVNQLNANIISATNDSTVLDQRFVVNSITTGNGADITNSDDGGTTTYELQVDNLTEIGNGTGTSQLRLYAAPIATQESLDTNTLTIGDGGEVVMLPDAGTAIVQVDSGLLDINTGGQLTGVGLIELTDTLAGPTILLSNDGAITANTPTTFIGQGPAAGTLQITATSADALFDWDGAGGFGELNVNGNQTLDIDVDTGSDAFGGTMNLGTGSTIDIADAWSLNTGTINANTPAFGFIIIGQDPNPGPAATIAGADWTMTGGTVNVDDTWDSLQFDSELVASGGTIENSGTMILNGGATIQSGVDFNMNGGGASLEINSTVNIDTPDFNLDGSALADNITTINSGGNLDLDLGAGADESFNHTINLNGTGSGLNEAELDVTTSDNTWELASNGQINVSGGGNSRINGETFEANGDIEVTGNSTLLVGAVTEFGPAASVTIEAGSTVNMGTTTYNGGTYTGAGILRKGTATIAATTAWNVDTVDIDDGTTTINDGVDLVVNTDSIDDSADGIDSTITIEDTATMTINLSSGDDVVFDSAGRLVYNGNTVSSTFLPTSATGSALAFNTGAELNINGDGTSAAVIKLNGGTLNINDAAEDFRLDGGTIAAGSSNEISGGTINGPGELQIGTGHALRGNGTINAQVDGDGSAQLVATGGTLNVNGGIEDIGMLGTSGGGAVLNVSSPWNTNVTSSVVLEQGTLQGSTITNDGVNGIAGNGLVLSRIDNNTVINATGNLVVQNTLNDWDGLANTGTLRANGGNLELRDNFAFLFNGTVEATNGTVFANNFELEFDPASQLNLSQGTYRSNRATDFGGSIDVAVGGASIIQVFGASSTFESTSTTTLNDTLRLEDGFSLIEVGATFVGGGSLQNANSHVLTLEDGANVGVLIENEGRLALGTSPGQATVLDFEQDSLGTLEIELEGTGLNDFDRLTATGLMQLDGLLELSLLGGFNPALNDTFTILSAVAGVNGVFSGFDFSGAPLAAGLAWDVIYNPTNVQLAVTEMAAFTADFDMDGDVDGFDLDQWEGDYGSPGSDANGDGTSNGTDFLAWQRQNGSGVAPLAAASAAVPEPSTLLLGGFAATLGLLIPRRKK